MDSPMKKLGLGDAPDSDLMDNTHQDSKTGLNVRSVTLCELPSDVLSNVFGWLPTTDWASIRLVHDRFRVILDDQGFMKYKKLYRRYEDPRENEFQKAKAQVLSILSDANTSKADKAAGKSKQDELLPTPSQCLPAYLRWACSQMTFIGSTAAEEFHCDLVAIDWFVRIETVLKAQPDLFKDCYYNLKTNLDLTLHPLARLAALLFFANSAHQIHRILAFLLRCNAAKDVLDFFYGTATLFLAMERHCNLPLCHHYNVYTALYWMENQSTECRDRLESLILANSAGRISPSTVLDREDRVPLTQEQLAILKQDVGNGIKTIKINAFAGTGKTTTLRRYAQARPQTKFLFVCFNKQIAQQARDTFPSNVEPLTTHQIAYFHEGNKYNMPGKFFNSLNVYGIIQAFDVANLQGFNTYKRANGVLATLSTFFSSDDDGLLLDHTPTLDRKGERISLDNRNQYLLDAQDIWEKMMDVKDTKAPMTHDGYLKLYQLSKKRIEFKGQQFDVVLVDEAQDLTPCQIDLFQNDENRAVPKIWVGDPHQQIYTFRGAVNAMDLVDADKTFFLTQSFRFGPNIGLAAMSLLRVLKKVDNKTLVGSQLRDTFYDPTPSSSSYPATVICRTNVNVFSQAVEATLPSYQAFWNELSGTTGEPNGDDYAEGKYEGGAGQAADIVAGSGVGAGGGDTASQNNVIDSNSNHSLRPRIHLMMPRGFLEDVEDLFHILRFKFCLVRNKRFKRFRDFSELKNCFTNAEDVDTLNKIAVVEKYEKFDLRGMLDRLRSHQAPLEESDLIFCTAHKAKGLEFDTVKLNTDFLDCFSFENPQNYRSLDEEFNLVYVAVTRAKKRLIMSPTMIYFLQKSCQTFTSLKKRPSSFHGSDICLIPECGFEASPNFAFQRHGFDVRLDHLKSQRDLLLKTQHGEPDVPDENKLLHAKSGFLCPRCSSVVRPHCAAIFPPSLSSCLSSTIRSPYLDSQENRWYSLTEEELNVEVNVHRRLLSKPNVENQFAPAFYRPRYSL